MDDEPRKITGHLTVTADRGEAMIAVADFTGRMRALGWDVDDIIVTIESTRGDAGTKKGPGPQA